MENLRRSKKRDVWSSRSRRNHLQDLVKHLKPNGFEPLTVITGLWFDNKSDTSFTLVVDDFGVKYILLENVNILITAIQAKYECSIN